MNASSDLKDTKNAKIMTAIFGGLCLLFVCGGFATVGIAGSGSESDGVTAAMAATGPACCAISGFLTSLVTIFAFPTQKMAQLIAPIAVAIGAGVFGVIAISVFFMAIWPSL